MLASAVAVEKTVVTDAEDESGATLSLAAEEAAESTVERDDSEVAVTATAVPVDVVEGTVVVVAVVAVTVSVDVEAPVTDEETEDEDAEAEAEAEVEVEVEDEEVEPPVMVNSGLAFPESPKTKGVQSSNVHEVG